MLPSSGYFRSVQCPFFVSGFCERPHCHFKHEKKGVSYASPLLSVVQTSNEDSIEQKNDLLQYYSDAIKKLQDELNAGSTLIVNQDSAPIEISDTPVTYIPTPVNKTKTEIPPSSRSVASNEGSSENEVFEYKPTPICKLNKLKGIAENDQYIPIRVKSKSTRSKKRNHEEYDPTKVVPSAKKLKTIDPKKIDPSSSSENDLCIDMSINDGSFSDEDDSHESIVVDKNITSQSLSTTITVDKEALPVPKCDEKYDVLNKILTEVKRTEKLGKVGIDHEKIDRAVEMCKKAKEPFPSSNVSVKSNDAKKEIVNKRKVLNTQSKLHHSLSSNNKSAGNEQPDKSEKKLSSKDKISGKSEKSPSNKNNSSKSDKNVTKSDKSHSKTGSSASSSKSHKSSSKSKGSSSSSSKDKDHKKGSTKEHKSSSDKEHKSSSDKEHKSSSDKEHKSSSDKEHKNSLNKEHGSTSDKDHKKKGKHHGEKDHKKSSSSSSKNATKSSSKSSGSLSESEKSCSQNGKSKSEKHSSNKEDKKESKSKENDSGSEGNEQKENRKKSSNSSSKSSHSSGKSKKEHTSSSSKSSTKNHSSKSSNSLHKKSSSSSSSHKNDKSVSEKSTSNKMDCSTSINKSSENLNDETGCELLDSSSSVSNNLFRNIEEKIEMDKLLEEYGSELDEHDTEEECWRIFNEERAIEQQSEMSQPNPVENPEIDKKTKEESTSSKSVPLLTKKRLAHQPTFSREMKAPKKIIQSPAEILQLRYEKLQQMYIKSHPVEKEKPLSPPSFVNSSPLAAKKRLAHVPNAALIAAASQRVAGKFAPANNFKNNNVAPVAEITIAVTNPKGTKRVAHVPSESVLARPKLPVHAGSKVPHNTRQRYLDRFIEECLKFCSTADDAYKKALEEENLVYGRSSNKKVYLNLAVNSILKLRLEGSKKPSSKTSNNKYAALAQKQTVSHEAMLGGAKAAKTTYSIEKKPKHTSAISGHILYKLMTEYLLTQEQLEENGYPLPNPEAPGKAIFKKLDITKRGNLHDPLEKTCCRCQKWYRVDSLGNYVTESTCSYHWGRLYKRKVSGSWQSRYSCCDGDHESIACCEADGHVHEEFDPDKITGFMQTFAKPPPEDGNYGVYALDCEMCYTSNGTELTRITVIGEDLKPVYETFVKPSSKVLDYNTRFSGITESDLKYVSTTIRDVQAVLLSMFSDKTILIGHSLESDFRALRLIHNTVIDTAIVFPHKNGPPFKRALRSLVAEHLMKIIQNSVDGHDSQEDAASCMELMLWKIKQDMFKRR